MVIGGKFFLLRRGVDLTNPDYLTCTVIIKAALIAASLHGVPISSLNQHQFVTEPVSTFREFRYLSGRSCYYDMPDEQRKQMTREELKGLERHFQYIV
jgi:hypothetical protein